MARKKTAAATEETLAPQEGQTPAAPADAAAAPERQPGDEPAEGKQKSSWAPRTTIASDGIVRCLFRPRWAGRSYGMGSRGES